MMTLRAIDVLTSGAPWAIIPEMMETIESILNRETNPESVAKELGRPLQNTRSVEMRGDVAIIPISGPIFPKANLFTEVSGATSIEVLALDFNKALENPAVKAIVLDLNSPGGQVTGVNEFAGMVRGAGKKVVAYVGGMAASAAYWIASAADEVVVEASAMAGNIGVVVGYHKNTDTNRAELVSSRAPDKRPDMNTEAGRAVVQGNIDAMEDVFLNTVAAGRGVSVDSLTSLRGRILVGQEAVDAGLADRLGSLESVIAGLSGVVSKSGGYMAVNDKNAPDVVNPVIEVRALTLDSLKADHPDVYQAVFDAGVASVDAALLRAEGASAERDRIQAVENQLIPGHEDLVATMKFDGKTTGGEAAIAVLQAEQKARANHLSGVQSRMDPLETSPAPSASSHSPQELAQQAKAMVAEAEAAGIKMSLSQAMKKIKEGN